MAQEKKKRRLLLNWRNKRGLLSIAVYLGVAFSIEFFMVSVFSSLGLNDNNALIGTFASVAFSISLVFHLIPLAVIATLLVSWLYLTKFIAFVPIEKSASTRQQTKKRPNLPRAESAIKQRNLLVFLRLSPFAKTVIKSGIVVFSLFFFVAFVVLVALQPTFLYHNVVGLYGDNQFFRDFIASSTRTIASLNNFLSGAAVSFAKGMTGLSGIGTSLVNMGLLSKYLVCQNLAVLISVITVILYGRFRQ